MRLFKRLFNRKKKERVPARRTYSAAQINRLTAGWITQNLTSDAELRRSLRVLRARSRELEENNDYAKRFFHMVKSNVVGSRGILLQNKAMTIEEVLDTVTNEKMEEAWREWGRKENASVEGTRSWCDMQNLFINTVARDGEAIVRLVKGYGNVFGFSLQFIESDHLDEDHNEELSDGNRIIMGVEFDKWKRPVAYHLRTQHPGEYSYFRSNGKLTDLVPADEIIHGFIPWRSTQSRGVPWMHTAMLRLNMLGGYEEAELIGARVAACKMGFFVSPDAQGYTGDDKDASGKTITEAEPGSFEQLPTGTDFRMFDPKHPDGVFPFFIKAILRGIASGINVSYNSLASDLEGVNYSSIRQGVLDERDHWRMLQGWMIEHFCDDVFRSWLPMALLAGKVDFSASDLARVTQPTWQPRGWAWVDPEKDQNANIEAVDHGMKTRQMVLAEQGLDIEDVFKQLAAEKELAKKWGLDFSVKESKPTQKTEVTDAAQNA